MGWKAGEDGGVAASAQARGVGPALHVGRLGLRMRHASIHREVCQAWVLQLLLIAGGRQWGRKPPLSPPGRRRLGAPAISRPWTATHGPKVDGLISEPLQPGILQGAASSDALRLFPPVGVCRRCRKIWRAEFRDAGAGRPPERRPSAGPREAAGWVLGDAAAGYPSRARNRTLRLFLTMAAHQRCCKIRSGPVCGCCARLSLSVPTMSARQ